MSRKTLGVVFAAFLVVSFGFITLISFFNAVELPVLHKSKVHWEAVISLPQDVLEKLAGAVPQGSISMGPIDKPPDELADEGFHWASYHDAGAQKYYLSLTNIGTRPYWVRWEPAYRVTGRSFYLGAGERVYIVISSSEKPKLMKEGKAQLFTRSKEFAGVRLLGGSFTTTWGDAYLPASSVKEK